MKAAFLSIALLILGPAPAWGQAHIIKQRARELNDQNNARQGIPPKAPATPARPAPGVQQPGQPAQAQPAVASPEMLRKLDVNNLKSDIASMKPGTKVPASALERLTRNLTDHSRGAAKAGSKAIGELAADLAKALPQTELPTTTQGQLAENIVAILNSGTLTASQTQGTVARVENDLQRNGADRRSASAVAADLKSIADELQPASKR